MNVQFRRNRRIDSAQELEKLLTAMTSVQLSNDLPRGEIQSGKQRGGPVCACSRACAARGSRGPRTGDTRMEAATVFLAARAGKPVIVYDEGWCGRIVRQFGCGLAVSRAPHLNSTFFPQLPQRDQTEYRKLESMLRFRKTHTGSSLRGEFLGKLGLSDI